MGALGRVFRVREEEGRTVVLAVAMMFVTFAGSTMGQSGVDALFFDRIGPNSLPVMYLLQGATGLAVMLVLTGSLSRFDRRRMYVALPVVGASILLVERAVLVAGPTWIYRVLWLTSSVAPLLGAVFLWGTAGLVTDTRRAKRLFPLFGAGGILGAVVGGLLTKPTAAAIGSENLLIVWVASLGGSAVLCAVILDVRPVVWARSGHRPRRRQSAVGETLEGLAFVRRSPLLVGMTVAAVLFSVLFYSLYLPFAKAATARFPQPDQLAGFFGLFWASVTAAAFLVSVLLANRLLGWFGAAAMVLVLPVLYAGSFGILLVSSSFVTLVSIRFGVNVWLQGVSAPAWETLNNVIPETRRDQVRAFLNGGPSQAGTAIAGVVTLIGQQALTAKQLSVIGLVASVLTIVVAWGIRRWYTGALIDALHAGRPSVFEEGVARGAPILVDRDGQALGLALEAARDPDPHVRRLAIEILGVAADDRARGALVQALEDDDPLVRVNAVIGLHGYEEVALFERALEDPDAGVRLAAVSALRTQMSDQAVAGRLTRRIDDPDPSVAAAAAAALMWGPSRQAASERLRRSLAADDPDVRMAALGQLSLAPPDDVAPLASPLLADDSPRVRATALETLAAAGPHVAIGPALEGLADEDPSVQGAAVDALASFDLRGYESMLRGFADARISLAAKDGALAASIPANGEVSDLLRDAIVERGRRRAFVALSTLALLNRDRLAMRTALDNLDASDPGQVANALETLEVSAGTPIVRPLLSLWEGPGSGSKATHHDGWLEPILEDEDGFIRSCAELVQTTRERGDDMARSRTSMSPMERVLALRKIPLFAGLSPVDLQRLAGIAEERTYANGEIIAAEGELGEELHIVITGTVLVTREDGGGTATVASRGPGDVVGEMSIISRAPRIASLVAEGDVRTVRIGNREFGSMIRERPEVSLAVMRVLAERLAAATADRTPTERV